MIRQIHRWTSVAFTLTVIANFVAMAMGPVPAAITYSPLPLLFVMLVTGLFMFFQPMIRRSRSAG